MDTIVVICRSVQLNNGIIESYVSNSHIGFDPDYECHYKTPDERMAYLVIVVVQEGNNK